MIAAGQDLDWIDAQGATLVRRGARLDWAGGGSGPEPRPARTKLGQCRWRPSLYSWGLSMALDLPHLLGPGVPLECGKLVERGSAALRSWGWESGALGGRLGSAIRLFCL